MKYKIAVFDNINLLSEAEEKLQSLSVNPLLFPRDSQTTKEEMISRTSDAEAVLVSINSKITEDYLTVCPTVKYVGLCGTSTANIDFDSLKRHKVAFSNVKDYGDEPAAEYMFMLLLMLARGEGKYQWQKMPTEIMGKSIGIIGLGALGKAVANLSLGYKMKVNYYSPHRKIELEKNGIKFMEMNTLLKNNDIIVISTPTNVKVLGKPEFELIKPNSVLMYLSSGEAFDKLDFIEWISNKNNFALFNYSAGEDYFQSFKDLPNVIFPKIIAGHTRETKQRLGEKVINNLLNYFNIK